MTKKKRKFSCYLFIDNKYCFYLKKKILEFNIHYDVHCSIFGLK